MAMTLIRHMYRFADSSLACSRWLGSTWESNAVADDAASAQWYLAGSGWHSEKQITEKTAGDLFVVSLNSPRPSSIHSTRVHCFMGSGRAEISANNKLKGA